MRQLTATGNLCLPQSETDNKFRFCLQKHRIPTYAIRRDVLELALRLKGSYAPAQSEQATKTVSCIVLDIPRPPRPGINPSENGHHKKDVKGTAIQMGPAKAHPPDGHPHTD
jgi:hypothetical protein